MKSTKSGACAEIVTGASSLGVANVRAEGRHRGRARSGAAMALLRGESGLGGPGGVLVGSCQPGAPPCHPGRLPKRARGSVPRAGPAALPEGAAPGAGGAARAGSLSPSAGCGVEKKKGKWHF